MIDNTLQAYTPGSDIAAAFQPYQINWGRTGNDTLIGYNILNNSQNASTLDVLVGDIEIPLLVDPVPRNWQNRYVLGDWQQAYYTNGNPFILGLDDFAIIIDFEPEQDIIQLNGSRNDYQTFEFFLGTVLWYEREVLPGIVLPDVAAILPAPDLDLDASYFDYVGNAPLPISLDATKQIGTAGFELAISLTTDQAGHVYAAGGTSDALAGENQGNRDIWFAKYDRDGNEIWRQQFGSENFDFLFEIEVDAASNVYVAGSTQGNLGGPLASDISDAWIAKFDPNGQLIWVEQFDNPPYFVHNVYALDVDAAGNISVSGVSVETPPEGAELPTTADAWVARYDTDGNEQWFQQLKTPNDPEAFDESYAIALDQQGSVFTAGFTTGAIGSTPFEGLYDAWIAKNDANGQPLWAQNIGTADYDWAWGLDTNAAGDAYATGWTLGDLGGPNAGSFDAWLIEFDAAGNQQWVHQFGTSGDDEAFGVTVDESGNIYVTGYTNGAFDGYTNQGSFDAWVASFDQHGNQKWISQFGTAATEQAYDIAVKGGDVYVTGLTDGSLGSVNQGSLDAWVARLDAQSGSIKTFDQSPQPVASSSVPTAAAHLVDLAEQDLPAFTDAEITHLLNEFFSDFPALDDIALEPYEFEPTNLAPIAIDDDFTTDQGLALSGNVLVNDTDLDSDALTVAMTVGARNGVVNLNPDGTFNYRPNAGFSGDDSFTYELNDGTATDTAVVAIAVQPTTSPPLAIKLFDADSDTVIAELEDGDEILASVIGDRIVTIVAFAPQDSPLSKELKSVSFDLNNGQVIRTESVAPYALFGDNNSDFNGRTLPVGEHTITVDLYNAKNRQGERLATITRDFTIVDDIVDSQPPKPSPETPVALEVGLYDARSDELIQVIQSGDVIQSSQLPTQELAIAAFLLDGDWTDFINSVRLNFNEGQMMSLENIEPYALFGDINGDLKGGSLPKGDHQIAFELFDQKGGEGQMIDVIDMEFSVV